MDYPKSYFKIRKSNILEMMLGESPKTVWGFWGFKKSVEHLPFN